MNPYLLKMFLIFSRRGISLSISSICVPSLASSCSFSATLASTSALSWEEVFSSSRIILSFSIFFLEFSLSFVQLIDGFCCVEPFFKSVSFFLFFCKIRFEFVNLCLFLIFGFHLFLQINIFFFCIFKIVLQILF